MNAQDMFPTIEVHVLLNQQTLVKGHGNIAEDEYAGVTWDVSRCEDTEDRRTAVWALANVLAAQLMTRSEFNESIDLLNSLYGEIESQTT